MLKTSLLLISLIYIISLPGFPQSSQDSTEQYLFKEFVDGTVLLKSGIIVHTKLNYNNVNGEMLFIDRGIILKMGNPDIIDTVFIGTRTFIPQGDAYYELLFNGPVAVFIQHKGTLIPPAKISGYGGRSQTAAITQQSSIIMNGMSYNLKLPDDFTITKNQLFWIKKENKFYKFNSENQAINVFPEKKEPIKNFLRENKMTFKTPEGIIALVIFCGNL